MFAAMSPGIYIALGIIIGAVLSFVIGNAFIGIGIGVVIGIAWYYGLKAMAARRRP
jgi:hypothetical protein